MSRQSVRATVQQDIRPEREVSSTGSEYVMSAEITQGLFCLSRLYKCLSYLNMHNCLVS